MRLCTVGGVAIGNTIASEQGLMRDLHAKDW
jgi:hypothetical protein